MGAYLIYKDGVLIDRVDTNDLMKARERLDTVLVKAMKPEVYELRTEDGKVVQKAMLKRTPYRKKGYHEENFYDDDTNRMSSKNKSD